MKKNILIPILLCATSLFAQEQKTELQKQQQEIVSLNQKLSIQQVVINQQKTELAKLSERLRKQPRRPNDYDGHQQRHCPLRACRLCRRRRRRAAQAAHRSLW